MKYMIMVVTCCFLLAAAGCTQQGVNQASSSGSGRPGWIMNGETASHKKSMFWLAVGSGDSPEEAARSARQEVAAQIKTRVRSRITDVTRMEGKNVQQRFNAINQNITDARLEGLEIIEQYGGKRRSYALAGLNKSVYLGKISDNVNNLYQKANQKQQQAMQQKSEGRFNIYFKLMSECLSLIDDMKTPEYFYRSFKQGGTPSGNLGLQLERTIEKELVDFFSKITVSADTPVREAQTGKPLKKPLKATFEYESTPVSDFPVSFRTLKGRVVCEPDAATDKEGTAACNVTRVEKSPVRTIKIACSLKTGKTGTQVKGLRTPGAVFKLKLKDVSQWIVFIDETGGNNIITGAVVSGMKKGGVDVHSLNIQGTYNEKVFVQQAAGKFKDYCLVTGKITARKTGESMGNLTARADGTIKAYELSSGRILFQENLHNVIGVSYTGDVDEALRNALNNAAKKCSEIVKKELGY